MATNIAKLTVITAVLFMTYSCQDNGGTAENKMESAATEVKEAATTAAEEVKEAFKRNDDSDFVVNATQHNYTEMKLLEAAATKGTDKEVKADARAMLTEHRKIDDKIKAFASSKNYPIPADDGGKAQEELASIDKNAKGKDWDKAWADEAEDYDGKLIDDVETASKNTKDSELKAWADATLPTLRTHKVRADKLKERLSK